MVARSSDAEVGARPATVIVALSDPTGAPQLEQKTWYGFPSYAKDGALLFFFKPASKFKTRFSTPRSESRVSTSYRIWSVAMVGPVASSKRPAGLARLAASPCYSPGRPKSAGLVV